MDEVFFSLCKTIDTPASLGAYLRYKYSHSELASFAINAEDYNSASAFQKDYSIACYLKKYTGLNTGVDLSAVAIQKFKSSEDDCRLTNKRFRSSKRTALPFVHEVFHLAGRKISKLLGPFSLFCVNPGYGWGPGATLEIARRRSFVDTKISELPITVTQSALSVLKSEIESDLHWSAVILGHYPEGPYSLVKSVFRIVPGCRITTVPKDAKTDRVIAIEPRGNAFLQKGAGAFFRKRLRTVGVDLDNQGINQDLARRAFSEGYATLDLKAASDSISKLLVYELLPYDWAEFLDSIRSTIAQFDSMDEVVLEKFSSMGNGFTFELESLIFWALAQSVSDLTQNGDVCVYGDDVIVKSACYHEVVTIYAYAGFTVNDEKSFFSGNFYESCGKHYFMGQDVTPAYQKEKLEGTRECIRAGNRLIRLAFRACGGSGLDRSYHGAWSAVRRVAGIDSHRYFLPFGSEGDDGWLLPESVFPKFKISEDILNHGIRCTVVASTVRSFPANDLALLAQSLRRGVVTEVPYLGMIESNVDLPKVISTKRRVIPSGLFALDWV